MKADLKLYLPLWHMTFTVLIAVIAIGLDRGTVDTSGMRMTFELGPQDAMLVMIPAFIALVLVIAYISILGLYNKQNPGKEISPFSIRPPEYMEEDEGMVYVTRKVVQQVYSFNTLALPLIVLAAILFPLPRLFFVLAILAVMFTQYLIYFIEMRKFFKEAAE